MQTVLWNGNLCVYWMLSLSSEKSATAIVPLQVCPAAGGHTVEHTLYASLRHLTVAGYPLETPHSPCHRQTWPTHLSERHRKTRHMKHLHSINWDWLMSGACRLLSHKCDYLLSFWPIPHSGLRSLSGLGASAQPAGRSSHCCWNQGLQEENVPYL